MYIYMLVVFGAAVITLNCKSELWPTTNQSVYLLHSDCLVVFEHLLLLKTAGRGRKLNQISVCYIKMKTKLD